MSLIPPTCFQYFTDSMILSFVTSAMLFLFAGSKKPKNSIQATEFYKNSIYKREIVLAAIAKTARVELAIGLLGHIWPCFCVLILALPLSTADILRLITKWVASWSNRPSMIPLLPLGEKK